MRLLYVEDEDAIASPLVKGLERRKYAVDHASDGNEAIELFIAHEYDCIILDLNLPGIDGIEVAKRVRQESSVPIIMLTARITQDNILEGFHSGTDDYMTKPFSFQELLARIEAILRRTSHNDSHNLTVSDIELDPTTKLVTKAESEIELNNKEYGILEYLLRSKGRPVSQEQLLEHV